MEVVTRWTSCVPPLWVVIFKKTNVVNFGVFLDLQNLRTRLSNFFLKTQQRNGKQRTRGSSRAISSHCLKVHFPNILLLIGMLYKSVRLVDLFNVLCLLVWVNKLSEGVTCDDCYMRLQRQATEWGKKYKFRFSDQVNLDLAFCFFLCFFVLVFYPVFGQVLCRLENSGWWEYRRGEKDKTYKSWKLWMKDTKQDERRFCI